MSGNGGGNAGTPESGAQQPNSASENAESPNDAPGAPSATPGEVAPSGGAGAVAPPGSDRDTTEEHRSESVTPANPDAMLHGCPVAEAIGAKVVHCNRESYLDLCRALKADGFAMPVGLTGVDYLTHPGRVLPEGVRQERFEVVVELADLVHKARIRVRCQVPAADPRLPSLFEVWPGTEFHERETYDMFGIRFDGHPDLSRILMPEDWEGHPLRKDYDTGHVPVQFKEAPRGATI